jgi:hypothetical protein
VFTSNFLNRLENRLSIDWKETPRGTLKALIIFNNLSHLAKFREKANEDNWRTYVGDGVLGEFAKNEPSSSEPTIGRPLQDDEANVEAVSTSTEDPAPMSTVTKASKEERKRKKREQEEEAEVTGEILPRKKKVNNSCITLLKSINSRH